MADTLKGFSFRLIDAERIAHEQAFAATKAVTTDLTAYVRSAIRIAAPGGRVRGKRGKPVRIGAGYSINTARREGFVFARGPLQLVERDTKPHREPKPIKSKAKQRKAGTQLRDAQGRFVKKGTVGAKPVAIRKTKVMKIAGIGFRRSVMHPGTHGKHPFMTALRTYESSGRVSRRFEQHLRKTLQELAR